MFNWIKFLLNKNINKIIKIKLAEANDWIRKYFKAASDDSKLFALEINGINLNKLISNPIQQPSQEFDEIEIKDLKIKIIKNKKLLELILL